jgi:hypothetical protein
MTEQLYHFGEVESVLNNEELKKMWAALRKHGKRLKNARFTLSRSSGIGTNFFMFSKTGEALADITDYHSW